MSFQGFSKDIKRYIANFLDDIDILSFCQINKEQNRDVCNEIFFKNLLLKRYPYTLNYLAKQENRVFDGTNTLNYIHENRSSDSSDDLNYIHSQNESITFKKCYLLVVHYVDLLAREYSFDYRKYNLGDPKHQYF